MPSTESGKSCWVVAVVLLISKGSNSDKISNSNYPKELMPEKQCQQTKRKKDGERNQKSIVPIIQSQKMSGRIQNSPVQFSGGFRIEVRAMEELS